MRVVFCLLPLLLGSAAFYLDGTADIADFDQIRRGYEFVFHDDHNLLLIIHKDVCHYVQLPDDHEWRLRTDDEKMRAEDYLIHQIEEGRSIQPSDLQTVRETYADLLANYRCSGKQISELTPDDHFESWFLEFVDTAEHVVDTAVHTAEHVVDTAVHTAEHVVNTAGDLLSGILGGLLHLFG